MPNSPSSSPVNLGRRRSAQAGALALSLLLVAPSAALADGGTRHGGARRAPPPPPPAWSGSAGTRTQAPSAPRVWAATQPQATSSNRGFASAPHAPGRLGNAPTQASPGFASASGGVRPILPGQAPRVVRTQPLASGSAAAPTLAPRQLPSAPVASQPATGAASPWAGRDNRIRPPAGTPGGSSPSPRWDNRTATVPSLRPPSQVSLPATPRASLPRAVAPASSTAGVRYGAPATPAAPRVVAPSGAPRSAGVRYGAPGTPRTGFVAAPSTSPHYTGSAGAGVRYGGAPHASGVYRYPAYGPAPVLGRPWYGYGIGHRWYPAPAYGGVSIALGFWGFGGCGCDPVLVPSYEVPSYGTLPYAYPAPAWPVEAPGYVLPAPAPLVEPPPAAPYVAEPAPQAWPAPQLDTPPQAQPLPAQPAVPEPSAQAPVEPSPEAAAEQAAGAPLSAEDEQALRQSIDDFRAGRYGAAQAALEAVVARSPDLGHAWLGIAHAAFAMGRHTRAGEAVTRAALLGAFPRGYGFDPRALYAKPEDFLARKQALEEHVRSAPKDADARLVLAWLRVSLGERDLARADLDALLGLRPADEAAPILSLALLPPAPRAGEPTPQPVTPGQPR